MRKLPSTNLTGGTLSWRFRLDGNAKRETKYIADGDTFTNLIINGNTSTGDFIRISNNYAQYSSKGVPSLDSQ